MQIQTKIILELILGSRYRDSCSLQPRGGGGIADRNCFAHNSYFIADTDTEKSFFISAMISDKRYSLASSLVERGLFYLLIIFFKAPRVFLAVSNPTKITIDRFYHARRKSVSQVLFRRGMI